MKSKIFLAILVLFSVLFIFCTSSEKISIRPSFTDVKKVKLDIEMQQEFRVLDESLKSLGNGSILLEVVKSDENGVSVDGVVSEYSIQTNIGGKKPFPQYEKAVNQSFNANIDKNGNIKVDNAYSSPEFIKSSLEQLLALLVKGLPEQEIEIKGVWNGEFSVPAVMEIGANEKKYSISYKLDKYNKTENTVDILISGRVRIDGDEIESSSGTISGLLIYNIKKGFAIRLNVTEKYSITPKLEKASKVEVIHSTIINTTIE